MIHVVDKTRHAIQVCIKHEQADGVLNEWVEITKRS